MSIWVVVRITEPKRDPNFDNHTHIKSNIGCSRLRVLGYNPNPKPEFLNPEAPNPKTPKPKAPVNPKPLLRTQRLESAESGNVLQAQSDLPKPQNP